MMLATPCLLNDGRRVALLKGSEAAQLTGPGLPTTGCRLAELPAWGAWRLLALAGETGHWHLRDGDSVAEHSIAQWPATLATAHLVHFGHSDFGWADLPDRMRASFVQDLDLAIAACEATADRPVGEQFVWNVEIAALVDDWLAARKPADERRLAKLVAAGRIEIGGFTANVVQSPCDPEELMRICDRALRLGRRLGGTIGSAHQIDCPGLHPRLAAAMSAAGIRYLTWGANSQMSQDHDGWVPRCFRWRPDGRHEVQVWRHTQDPMLGAYASGGRMLQALDASPADAAGALARWLSLAADPSLPVALVTMGADFSRPVVGLCDFIAWWNRMMRAPKLRLSTNTEAHRDIETRVAGRLPLVTGHFPDAWVNLSLGLPDLSALARRDGLALRRAEQIAAWRELAGAGASPLDPASVSEELLRYNEHTYGTEGLCDRYLPATLDDIQQTASPLHRADDELRLTAWRDLAALGRRFQVSDGPLLVVVNYLLQRHTGIATARVHVRHLRHRRAWQVRDLTTGELVPHETDRPLTDHANYHQTTHRHLYDLSFLASAVPALGYRLYRLEAVDHAPPSESPGSNRAQSELVADPFTGAVGEWRVAGKSLLPAGALLGECRLFGFTEKDPRPALYTDKDKFYRQTEVLRPRLESLTPLPAGTLVTGYSARAWLGRQAKIELIVRAFAHAPFLDLELRVERPDGLGCEAMVMNFPAAIAQPSFACDAGGLTLNPLTDLAAGAFRDHLVADRWAAVHGIEGAIVLCSPEAPVTSFGGLHLFGWHREWPQPLAPELWSVLSLNGQWLCGNVTRRNRASTRWRFRVAPLSRFDPLAAQALGDAAAFPLTAELIEDGDNDAPFTAPSGCFASITEAGQPTAGVQLLSFGPGTVRLAERVGRQHQLDLHFAGQARKITLEPHSVVQVNL